MSGRRFGRARLRHGGKRPAKIVNERVEACLERGTPRHENDIGMAIRSIVRDRLDGVPQSPANAVALRGMSDAFRDGQAEMQPLGRGAGTQFPRLASPTLRREAFGMEAPAAGRREKIGAPLETEYRRHGDTDAETRPCED